MNKKTKTRRIRQQAVQWLPEGCMVGEVVESKGGQIYGEGR